VGTAKPTQAERRRVPHHGIDIVDPSRPFSVAAFQECARTAVDDIQARGKVALLVGGSGLYFRAVVDDLEFPGTHAATREELTAESEVVGAARLYSRLQAMDPVAASKMEPGNERRVVRALEVAAVTGRLFSDFAGAWDRYPADSVRVAGVRLDPAALRTRVEARVGSMLARGFLDEVRALVDAGFGEWLTSTQAIGYAEMAVHLAGTMTLEDAVAGTIKRTRSLARRQMAWFRRDPRIRWFEAGPDGAAPLTDDILEYLRR
jgi:tRNA dimethylallyltransferase